MIKYNNSNINDWYFEEDNIIKVYRNNAVCYYKITASGGTSGQTPCYAVVDDISQYQDTEFVDVFNKADEKWYKLNNLNQFEEYGLYGSGRTITYYEGKLTIDGDYEYMYSGSSWQNIGELTGTITVIKSPEYIVRNSSYTGYCGLLEYLTEDTKIIIKHRQTTAGGGRVLGDYNSNDSDDWRFFFYNSKLYYDFITQRQNTSKSMPMTSAEEWEVGNYYIKNTATDQYYIQRSAQTFSSRPAPLYIYHSDGVGAGETGTDYGEIYYIKIYKNNVLVRDFIPWTDMNGNYGLYDKVENELVRTTGQMTASTTINDVKVGSVVYPLYYTEKQDPPSGVTFSSMTEAEAYECPYVGLNASIDGTDYLFDVNYDWVTKYGLFPVTGEYICYNFDKYQKMEEKVRSADDTWSSQTPPVYERGEMIESASTDCSHMLPDVPFSVNYNAATYNASTKTFPRTYGQLVDVDAVISGSPSITVHDRYITYSSSGSYDGAFISGYQQYFNRTSSNPTLTIVAKAKTSSDSYCHLFANRYSAYNWMFRVRTSSMTLHGNSETGNIALISSAANIMSARVNSSSQVYYNNWTLGTSTSPQSFSYGSTNNMKVGMFNGYAGYSSGEYFAGDFYWIYISQTELTDEQIQQVIDYNENL